VMFALCAGAIVQVLLWKIPFRTGMIVFVTQLLVDIFAMAMLSLVFSFFVGVQEGANAKTHPRHAAGGHAGAPAGAHTNGRSTAAVPDGLPGMQHRIEQLGAEEGPFFRRLWRRWESVNQLLKPVYDLLQPVTRHLPLPARDFLNGGGWLIVIPGVIALLRSWPSLRPRKTPGVL